MLQWIRKQIKRYMQKYTIDMLFYHDLRCMENRKSGSMFFHYIALDGKCYKAKIKWKHEKGYLVFKLVRGTWLGERKLDLWKRYKFVSIWCLEESKMGFSILYKNPHYRYEEKGHVIL